MALGDVLAPLVGAATSAALQRTYLMQMQTATGIPKLLIVLDVVKEEEPKYTADVTKHPVESGPEVSDHIQLHNPTLRLKGTISNTPLDLSSSIGNLIAGGIAAVTSSQARENILNTGLQQAASIAGAALMGGAADPLSAGLAGSADAIARTILLAAYQNKLPFDVVTRRQRYTNMVIESLSFPRDAATGYQLIFEIEMTALRIVSPLQVQLIQLAESVIPGATPSADLGSQTGGGVSSQTATAVNGSWLRQIIKGVGG
jgi:hypothetical protein